jgi:hypothetical protein
MTVNVLTATSPDGQWKAEALLADPYNPEGSFVGEMDYARLTVYRTDGSQVWTPYEEWSPTGLGDSFLSEFTWSADGRYLYFTHRGNADGCGTPFVTNLRRVDLQDGSLGEIALVGLGLTTITISPGAQRMAYRTADGILINDLERGETRTLPYRWPSGFDFLVGEYAWSPDEKQLAFTIIDGFCLAPEARTSIKVLDLESGEIRTILDQAPQRLAVTGWSTAEMLQIYRDGERFFLELESGALRPDNAPAHLVSSAEQTLKDYLDSMNRGAYDLSGYERAVELYGGSYEQLVNNNPDIEINQRVALLRRACEQNGYTCLRLREVLSSEVFEGESGVQEIRFTVNLMNPDGSVFALGPCCGEETGEPQTEFVFTVRQVEKGRFVVLELPPYIP